MEIIKKTHLIAENINSTEHVGYYIRRKRMDLMKNLSHCVPLYREGGLHNYGSFQIWKHSVQSAEGTDFQYGHDGV
jgi:hypothetical protein